MMFDIANSEFQIEDVFRITRTNDQLPGVCPGRRITSLSARLSGYSDIELFDGVLRPDSENYLLIPGDTPFTHIYRREEVIAIHLSFTKNPPKTAELIYCPSPRVKEIFLSLYESFTQKQPGYICRCKSLVYEMFYLFARASVDKPDSKLRPSMDYLYENYARADFDLCRMISASALSDAYFRRLFREVYGTTVIDFLNSLRIDRAKSLLESTDKSIKEISICCGFSDDKYFLRVFKDKTGTTPKSYRSGR